MTRNEFLRLAAAGSVGSVAAAVGGPTTIVGAAAPPSFPAGVTKAVVDFIAQSRLDRIPDKVIVEAPGVNSYLPLPEIKRRDPAAVPVAPAGGN